MAAAVDALDHFLSLLNSTQKEILASLESPAAIQRYLDGLVYSPENRNRNPLNVMEDGLAHCLDGALMAATAMRHLGYPPRVIDLLPDPGSDDDHVLVIYQRHGCYGSLAKSNFVGLRSREPVFRTLRELVLSYFEFYFNVDGVKTLRAYTRPVNLASLDSAGWMWSDAGADAVEKHLWKLHPIPLIHPETAAGLNYIDPLSYRAGTLVVNPEGLYRPKKS